MPHVRLTIDRSLTDTHDVDLEAAIGTSLAEVVDGVTSKRAWCGSTLLDPSHQVGTYPLVHGARLRDGPGPHTAALPGWHLAAIAGPDAGALIGVDAPVTVGSAQGPCGIRDDAMDAAHLRVAPTRGGAIACRDLASTNGTGWWRRDGERWWWWGFRRRFTAHEGDILSVGNTALQVRRGDGPPGPGLARPALVVGRVRAALPWTPTPAWDGLPDPTTVAAWTGPVTIAGPHAHAAARAVILARGRRPPAPAPFDEDWLRWLPAARASDGQIRCVSSAPGPEQASLDAHATQCRVPGTVDTAPRLPIAVSQHRADDVARRLASTAAVAWPHAVRWADVDRPRTQSRQMAPLSVALGAVCAPRMEPWLVTLDERTPHLLVAGAPRSGASTLLATLVGGLTYHYDPQRLSVVLIGSGTDGPLAPCGGIPHVRVVAPRADGDEAVVALEAAAAQARWRREALHASGKPDWRAWEASSQAPARLLVVIDDFDLTAGRSRVAAATLEALANSSVFVGVHVALATHRPAGAITPVLRASCAHTVALQCASESDSLGVIGVTDAAILGDVPGRALAGRPGQREMVQVAQPAAETSPRVHRVGSDVAPALHLADAVATRSRQDSSSAPDRP